MPHRSSDRSRRNRLALLLSALSATTALSVDMSLPALPQLQAAFGVGVAPVQLTLSLFLVGYSIGQLVCGPLSDRVGRRPVLLGGLTVFTLAGLGCAVSGSLGMLVAMRFVQGMGASVGPILARAVVRDGFSGREAAGMLSQVTQVTMLAPLLAPTLGGYVLVALGWPAIFLVLGATGVALWVVSWRRLPETLPPREAGEEKSGWREVLRGYRTVLSHRASLRHILTTCFSYAGMFAYISASPFVLIDGFGVARESFGHLFALTAAALMLGATLNRVLLARLTPDDLLRAGVRLVLAAGVAILASAWLGVGGVPGVLLPMMAYMLGLGLVQPNATAAAMAPHGRLAGLSSSLVGGLQTVAGALSGYLVGSFYDQTPRALAVGVAGMALLTWAAHGPARVGTRPAGEAAVAAPLGAEA